MARQSRGLVSWLDSWVQCGSLPGASMGVYDSNGNALFLHIANSQDLTQQGKPYQEDTLFRIYSMTKPITSIAALMLIERGLLRLDDEVAKYIPAFKNIQVAVGGTVDEPILEPLNQPINILHLMTHTSGISYGIFGNNLNDQAIKKLSGDEYKTWFHNVELSKLCEIIAQAPLCFQPGSHFHYSLSTDVLGHIVEIVSGMKLDEFFQKEIFQPLGMNNTYFQVPADQAHRLADCYDVAVGKSCKPSVSPERDRLAPRVLLAGGGGLVSTISDYAKFTTFLVNKGCLNRVRLLSEETIELMTRNHLPDNKEIGEMSFENGFSEQMGPGWGFGLGVSIVTDPSKLKGGALSHTGEYGWGGVAGTYFFIDPVRKVSSIFMTQLIPGAAEYPIRAQMRWLTYSCLGMEKKEE
jgi:CubicO group peptidase (beta-lactamase class C family)